SSKGEHSLYVYAGNTRIGKLNLHVFDEKEIDVVIVPIANATLDSSNISAAVNGILGEANIKFNISTAPQWNNADFTATTTIDLPSDVTNFNKYSDHMRNLRDTYFDSVPNADKSKYYIFVVEGFTGSANEEGYMVRGKGLGFVTKNATPQTHAHELGHGAGALAHTWKNNGPEEGTTDNLMDYSGGSNLTLGQWEELRKLKLVPSFWDDEEDAMKSSASLFVLNDLEFLDDDFVGTQYISVDKLTTESVFKTEDGVFISFNENELDKISKVKTFEGSIIGLLGKDDKSYIVISQVLDVEKTDVTQTNFDYFQKGVKSTVVFWPRSYSNEEEREKVLVKLTDDQIVLTSRGLPSDVYPDIIPCHTVHGEYVSGFKDGLLTTAKESCSPILTDDYFAKDFSGVEGESNLVYDVSVSSPLGEAVVNNFVTLLNQSIRSSPGHSYNGLNDQFHIITGASSSLAFLTEAEIEKLEHKLAYLYEITYDQNSDEPLEFYVIFDEAIDNNEYAYFNSFNTFTKTVFEQSNLNDRNAVLITIPYSKYNS
ncbi:MAG: hypothetical protein WD625_02700, partial [Balneolales bacterium]